MYSNYILNPVIPASSSIEIINVLLKCIMPELKVSFKKCILFFQKVTETFYESLQIFLISLIFLFWKFSNVNKMTFAEQELFFFFFNLVCLWHERVLSTKQPSCHPYGLFFTLAPTHSFKLSICCWKVGHVSVFPEKWWPSFFVYEPLQLIWNSSWVSNAEIY